MTDSKNPIALWERALCLAEDDALFGDDEPLARIRQLDPKRIAPAELRMLKRFCEDHLK